MVTGIIWAAATAVVWAALFAADFKNKPTERDVVYLPASLFAVGSVLLFAGSAAAVYGAVSGKWLIVPFGAIFDLVGIAAILCRINQRTALAEGESFTYTTFLGRKRTYMPSDVVDVRRNQDSYTIVMKRGKIHVENMARVNEKFIKTLISER